MDVRLKQPGSFSRTLAVRVRDVLRSIGVSHDGIGKRLLAGVLLFSGSVTLVLTAIQLYLDYRRDVSEVERRLAQISSSYRDSLAESLWAIDEKQLREANIRLARPEADGEALKRAIAQAALADFVAGLPEGLATRVGERGVQLSGGQRQRIAIARAFLKDAPILILDEPTSSIDSKTEAVILDALDRLMLGRTTFMIAHRLSTVRRADIILVIDKGKLVEQGSHESLLALGGLYYQLHTMQTQQMDEEGAQDSIELQDGVLEGQA